MKIYLAAPYAMRVHLRDTIKPLLESFGHEVTSRWIHHDEDDPCFGAVEEALTTNVVPREMKPILQTCCDQNLADIDKADAIVRFNPGGQNTLIEWGYAIGKGKIAILVGPPVLMFDYAVKYQVMGIAQLLECLVWREKVKKRASG